MTQRRDVRHPSAVSLLLMNMKIALADIPIEISLKYENYRNFFEPFSSEGAPAASVCVTDEELCRARPYYPAGSPDFYLEYMELCPKVSDTLLPFRRVVFHALAFVWHERAWLLTAPSGTGKTTQYLHWKLLYKDELRILNGDKPVLAFSPDGEITVHPSPWFGKEGMRQMIHAPLGGIILLEQAKANTIRRITDREAAGRIFLQFLFSCATPGLLHAVCGLEEQLLRSVPLWLLSNCGDADSARLCHDTLQKEVLL